MKSQRSSQANTGWEPSAFPGLQGVSCFLRAAMEKPATRKKSQAPKKEAGAQKATVKEEKTSKGEKPRTQKPRKPHKSRKERVLSPEDEAHIFDAFDASFKDDFEGVPVFVPFQRKKPYECGEYGRIFKHKTDHIRHQRVHTGEKPFKCDQCGKTFRHSADVTKHQRIHTGEKPFKCGECEKAFSCGSNLLKHQKTHTGEKPYGCEECGKFFAYSFLPHPASEASSEEEALSRAVYNCGSLTDT